MPRFPKNRAEYAIFGSIGFVGCGGGGDGGDGTTQTGILVDGPVAGVSYQASTQSGVTGSDGSFFYQDGETVRFFLGDTLLGESAGQPQVSPFDLLAVTSVPTGHAALSAQLSDPDSPLQACLNLTVLLQTLDRDGDPDNGIEISAEVANLFDGVSLDFNKLWSDFQTDPSLRSVLNQINNNGLSTSYRSQQRAGVRFTAMYIEF